MTSRQNRHSENTMTEIVSFVRNLDKLVWNGQKWSVDDLQEHADIIKMRLDTLLEEFKKEVGYVEHDCVCHPKPEPDLGPRPVDDSPNTLGDKPHLPASNVLGDWDHPCDDTKCDCHGE